MISLKKHLDGWERTSPHPELEAYRSLLETVGICNLRAVPDLGGELTENLADLIKRLAGPPSMKAFASVHETALAQLSEWAERAFGHHEAQGRELKQVIDIMARALTSVTERDERYAAEVGDLTERLRSIATLSDLSLLRSCILESANSLSACVDRISADSDASRESLCKLAAQVDDYRSRLVKSETLSAVDPLTGLANRRRFEDQLSARMMTGKRFCLILMDLNGFKAVNDHHGHLAGDDLLRQFSGRLRVQFPSADLVARWGGDEFAVIITTSAKDAEARVHRIRRTALGEYRINTGGESRSVTVDASIGLAEWNGGETGEELLARVDRCMYQGKQTVRPFGGMTARVRC
jgi:diguanylate cyclase (GGDEF)-like protein